MTMPMVITNHKHPRFRWFVVRWTATGLVIYLLVAYLLLPTHMATSGKAASPGAERECRRSPGLTTTFQAIR
jgi:hypothetical protein